jgi:methyl-accepting chemotaxis protein
VAQVGESITNMDQATQQNAALVEEMAAAASSLKSQAQELVSTVAVFKLRGGQAGQVNIVSARAVPVAARALPKQAAKALSHAPRAKPVAAAPAQNKPVAKPAPDDDWASF